MKFITIIIICMSYNGFFLKSSKASALNADIPVDSTAADTISRNQVRLMLLPIVFSSPDTRLALGILPQLVFRTVTSANPSSIRLDAFYTWNKQYQVLLRPTFWFNNDTRIISGKLAIKQWPTSYYGIGNNTSSENREKFTETLYESSIEGTGLILPGLYTSLSYSLRYGKINPHNPTGSLKMDSITGNEKLFTSTLGLGLRWDTRNNHFYPSKGGFYRINLDATLKLLGSDVEFSRLTFDVRQYISVYKSHVLAFQGIVSTSSGNVPFRLLSSVGSTLRGYSTVRHIDRNLLGLQMEYRMVPLKWRIGLVAFAGVAEVFNQPEDVQLNHLKYSVGMGLRYQFSRSEKINIRFDYGFGRNSSGDYLDLNEAY